MATLDTYQKKMPCYVSHGVALQLLRTTPMSEAMTGLLMRLYADTEKDSHSFPTEPRNWLSPRCNFKPTLLPTSTISIGTRLEVALVTA